MTKNNVAHTPWYWKNNELGARIHEQWFNGAYWMIISQAWLTDDKSQIMNDSKFNDDWWLMQMMNEQWGMEVKQDVRFMSAAYWTLGDHWWILDIENDYVFFGK